MKGKRALIGFGAVLLALEVLLLVTGNRVLVNETRYAAREATSGLSFSLPASEAALGCTYFTGRQQVYEHLSSYDYDECPFIWTEH